ncbi:MAG: S-layer homology domain-containing protein [Candidatus Margulisbacteria bacterium]|nr:S-layer homology domain-containing protein [Candidatus Margulisiibacteriota bacterium]
MKYLLTFSFIIWLACAGFAGIGFNDVPKGHWAYDSVYDLVRMGVTGGYPDGTFQGTREVSRYEIASFLSKLSRYLNEGDAVEEKLLSELKNEVAVIKFEQNEIDRKVKFYGKVESGAIVSPTVNRGGKFDYRLKLSMLRDFDYDSNLKITLDTVDAGFNSSSDRPFATKLIDVEGKFKIGAYYYKVNLGPGVVPHVDSEGIFPSENYTIYIRPKTAVEVSRKIGKLSWSGSYVTRQVQTSGKIGVHELTTNIEYNYGFASVNFRPRYLFEIDGPHDFLAELGVDCEPVKKYKIKVLLGVGSPRDGTSGMYLKLIKEINDPWQTGTNIVARFDKVGSKYRDNYLDEYEFIYLNNFDRLILDGMVDIGLRIDQKIFDDLSLQWKGDYVTDGCYRYGAAYPETYFLWQLGLNYKLSSTIAVEVFYRAYNVPSEIAQFADPVPAFSDLFGVKISTSF